MSRPMCERFPYMVCIECLNKPCEDGEEDLFKDYSYSDKVKSALEMSRQHLMAYKEICEQDSLKEDDCVQTDFKDFRSAVEIRFVFENFLSDVSIDEQAAIVELLRLKSISCGYIDYAEGDAEICKVINRVQSTIKPVYIAEKMYELCKEAKDTVLRFGKPVNCKVNMIDGTRMHRDSSMPKVAN